MINIRLKSILIIKVSIFLLFSSQYNDELFFGFVNSLLTKDLNPWEYYLNNNLNLDAFPYHPLR
jgi:hypothetical protein